MVLLVALLLCRSAAAVELKLGGHLKYQLTHGENAESDLTSRFGPSTTTSHEIDLRLNTSLEWKHFDFIAHMEFLGLGSDMLAARKELAALGFLDATASSLLPDDGRRLFDLTTEVNNEEKFTSVLRLDRLAVGYTEQDFVIRAGRQAISWGNGLVFQVFDLFNPFSPVEIDKDYKFGDDMVYGQWLFPGGDDIQGLVVVRRDPVTNSINSEEASYALKWHGGVEKIDYDLVVAQHFNENVFGLGVSRGFWEAMWRVDLSLTELVNNESFFSFIANADRSWTVFDKNIYGFVEYFRNGVGSSSEAGYTTLRPELAVRISRGELFTLAKDYLATGLQIEWLSLLNSYFLTVFNLHDESGVFQLRNIWDWREDVTVLFGLNIPFGSRGSEFGGIPVEDMDVFLASGEQAYLRLSYFF